MRRLGADAQRIAMRNLFMMSETIRLQCAFDNAGIRVIVLKGVALAELAYHSLALKHGRDIDFLVAKDLALSAFRLLEQEGYRLSSPAKDLSEAQAQILVEFGERRNSSIRTKESWLKFSGGWPTIRFF